MLIRNARIVRPEGLVEVDIEIDEGKITKIARSIPPRGEVLDVRGMLVLPGAVDVHVHFRDPGLTHKEDWLSGSMAAAAGGVTTVVDHPNTLPPTLTKEAFEEKMRCASQSIVDYAINAGVTPEADLEGMWHLGAAAFGETFLAKSTGDLTIDENEFEKAARMIHNLGGLMCIHAEDAECIREASRGAGGGPEAHSMSRPPECEAEAINKVLRLAGSTKLHFAHLSSRLGLEALRGADATAEVAPHHLFLDTRDYKQLGYLGVMNPPLRSQDDRNALWGALRIGRIQAVASDHAPHLPEEKEEGAAGVPGVETMYPLLLKAAVEGLISIWRVVEVACENPARIYGLRGKGLVKEGCDADLVVVDPREEQTIHGDDLHSMAGWTPYEDMSAVFPRMTLVRGEVVYDGESFSGHGKFIPGPGLNRVLSDQ